MALPEKLIQGLRPYPIRERPVVPIRRLFV